MNTNQSNEQLNLIAHMVSLEKKLESLELLTSKGTVSSDNGVFSVTRRIDLTLDAMSRSLRVLHDTTEATARKVEMLGNLVHALILEVRQDRLNQEMNWEGHFPDVWSPAMQDWVSSLMLTPERGTSPDITCSETINFSAVPSRGPPSTSDGSMENPVQVSPDRPI